LRIGDRGLRWIGRNTVEGATMNRLDSAWPVVASRLRQADTPRQRAVAIAASKWAVATSGLDEWVVGDVLRQLDGGSVSSTRRSDLDDLVILLDEAAWLVQDAVDEGSANIDDYLVAFGKARAAAAVQFACDPDSALASLEAVYEASVVVSNNESLLAVVTEQLDGPT
jgi:hypothetical protein